MPGIFGVFMPSTLSCWWSVRPAVNLFRVACLTSGPDRGPARWPGWVRSALARS